MKYRILQVIFEDRDRNELLRRLSTTLDPKLTQELKKRVWNEKLQNFEEVDDEKQDGFESEIALSEKSSEDLNKTIKDFYRPAGTALELNRMPQYAKRHTTHPMLYGEFNNWQAQPMIPVNKIAQALDTSDQGE